ncbi:hypothetical protein CK203_044295 [Vitis vinifera]|uniref:Uncharacterized protein n=1 Tax=Vitis vinifera TaxID=29760 RepID=A0A438H7U4_VITVI|nr:hypothetical protein CK203_044295 [Vitis vinifera]
MMEATMEVWTTYTKAHLGSSQLRYKPIRNYDKLSILLGKDRATGSLAAVVAALDRSNLQNYIEEQLFEEIARIGGMSDVSHMKAYQALIGDVSATRAFLACPIDRREYGDTDILYADARRKNCEVFRLVFDFVVSPRFSTGKGGEMEEQIGEIPSVFKWEMINRAVHAIARGGNLEILKELLSEFWPNVRLKYEK